MGHASANAVPVVKLPPTTVKVPRRFVQLAVLQVTEVTPDPGVGVAVPLPTPLMLMIPLETPMVVPSALTPPIAEVVAIGRSPAASALNAGAPAVANNA